MVALKAPFHDKAFNSFAPYALLDLVLFNLSIREIYRVSAVKVVLEQMHANDQVSGEAALVALFTALLNGQLEGSGQAGLSGHHRAQLRDSMQARVHG